MWFEVMVGVLLALALWHYRRGALGLAIVATAILVIMAVVGAVGGVAWWWIGPRALLLALPLVVSGYLAERQRPKSPIADSNPPPWVHEESSPPDVKEIA